MCLLTHFLVGAVAGVTVVGFTIATRRWKRGALVAGLGLLGAMPFLLPFATHFRDGSPDVISFAPTLYLAEWIALGALYLLTRRSRTLRPVFFMLLALYALRTALLATAEPPFRMEWQQVLGWMYAPEQYAVSVILAGVGLVCVGAGGMAGKEAYCFAFREGWTLLWLYPLLVLANLIGMSHPVFNASGVLRCISAASVSHRQETEAAPSVNMHNE